MAAVKVSIAMQKQILELHSKGIKVAADREDFEGRPQHDPSGHQAWRADGTWRY
ncbi:MAG: hypothetical protein IPJ84_20375 [Bdellovibrionales bacterium]|nr:hypothetical protein [Bdellovibrionales bacterium]